MEQNLISLLLLLKKTMKILKILVNVRFEGDVTYEGEVEVKDHDQITRKYQRSTHQECNRSREEQEKHSCRVSCFPKL